MYSSRGGINSMNDSKADGGRGRGRSICLREPNGRIFEEGLFDSSEQNTIHMSGDVTGSTLSTVIAGVCIQVKQMPSDGELICNISQRDFLSIRTPSSRSSQKAIWCQIQSQLSFFLFHSPRRNRSR